MFKIVYHNNQEYLKWISLYFKRKKRFCFSVLNFVILKKEDYENFNKDKYVFDEDFKNFINLDFKYNKRVLNYIQKNRIYNYNLVETVMTLTARGFELKIEKEYDLDEVVYVVSIYRFHDLILTKKINESEQCLTEFNKILSGNVIMSENKEKYIIDYISKELSEYGINLSIYNYSVKETGYNKYEVNLENINNGKIIMIRDVLVNNENKIYSIGANIGLVL